jgi:chitinase
VYLGAPAFSQAGLTAYDAIGSAKGIVPVVKQVKGLGLSNFGGVMYWDGAEGMLNTEGGKNIMDVSYGSLCFALDFMRLSC